MNKIKLGCSAIICLVISHFSYAGTITTDLSIDAGIELTSGATDGIGSLDGSMTLVSGGTTTTSTITAAIATINPLLGSLTDTGDGIGADATLFDNDYGEGFFSGFINITNTSTTDYNVYFDINYDLLIDVASTDAFLDSNLSLDNDTLNSELFGTSVIVDTFFGNAIDGIDTGNFGGIEQILPSILTVGVSVSQGQTVNLSSQFDLTGMDLEGDGFSGNFATMISVARIESLGQPPKPIPEPSQILLMLIGLMLLTARSSTPTVKTTQKGLAHEN